MSSGTDRNGGRRASGELESSVLAILWSAPGPLTASQVNERLPGDLAHTTVVTILSRLHAKGILERRRAGRGHAYAPTRDQAAHTAEQMVSLLDHGTDRGADRGAVLAQFVSQLSDADERMLQQVLLRHPDGDEER